MKYQLKPKRGPWLWIRAMLRLRRENKRLENQLDGASELIRGLVKEARNQDGRINFLYESLSAAKFEIHEARVTFKALEADRNRIVQEFADFKAEAQNSRNLITYYAN